MQQAREKELQMQQLEQARQQFILKTQNLLHFEKEASPPKQSRRKVCIAGFKVHIKEFNHLINYVVKTILRICVCGLSVKGHLVISPCY